MARRRLIMLTSCLFQTCGFFVDKESTGSRLAVKERWTEVIKKYVEV